MILLKNGIVHTMESAPFTGDVLIDGASILAVAARLDAPDAERIDASGCHVIPGIIDAHCHIGMWEDGMGEEGADGNECSDPITPQMRAIDGLNPFDPCFDEAVAAEQTKANDMVLTVQDEELGTYQQLGFAMKLSKTPASLRKRAPRLGEDNKEYL